MKFAIITHAVHKIKGNEIFAYEPYVREMNLWLKYVDEVLIVAPVSAKEVSAVESQYLLKEQMLKPVQHDGNVRHFELVSESHEEEQNKQQMLKRPFDYAQGDNSSMTIDESTRHPEFISGSFEQESNERIKLKQIPAFDITSVKNSIQAIFKIPTILYSIYKAMKWADHIHLRCPGNIGLLGCIVQIGFPKKPKTVKYAGNWDPNSEQPLSYRIQKWILSNTFLTRNVNVLVYGEWPNQSKNIIPFFTASYSEKELYQEEEQIATSFPPRNDDSERHPEFSSGYHEKEDDEQMLKSPIHEQINKNKREVSNRVHHDWKQQITSSQVSSNDETERHSELVSESHNTVLNFIFVGTLSKGKKPLLSVKVIHKLKVKGYHVRLDIYGEGIERTNISTYILDNSLEKEVFLHGNTPKELVKKAYQKAHFLLFVSKSEGWPKVVAEAMFWGCVPITSSVSCIPYMLNNETRGTLVSNNLNEIVFAIEDYLKHPKKYKEQAQEAMQWSQQFTLERFEEEIGKLLNSPLVPIAFGKG